MKHMKRIIPLFLCSLFFISCSNDEGEGGRSSIEGYIYKVKVNDDLSRDTFPANDQRVQILYGNQGLGDDLRTFADGYYKFATLREGNYTIIAYTELPSGENIPVKREIKVSGNKHTYLAEDIYIEDGKAVETYYVTGTVMAIFMKKNSTFVRDTLPGVGLRVYLEKADEITFFDDIRAKEDGTFFFARLLPGDYRAWTVFETQDETDISVGVSFTLNEKGEILIDDEIVPDLGIIYTRVNY